MVIEAGYRSGTSVTARITKEQGKSVFCIPSSLENRHGITCNEIIQSGGKLITCVEDILEEFKDIKFIKKENNNANFIEEEYQDVYKLISNNPQHINEIVKQLNSNVKDVSYKLMMLELEDYIIELPGKYFIRK